MKSIGELVTILKGRKAPEVYTDPQPGAERYLQIDDLRGMAMPRFARDPKGVLANRGDVLLAWDGANAGTVGFGLEGYAGSTIAILRPQSKNVYGPFLGYFLHGKFDYIQKHCTGATIPHVNRRTLEEMELELPPLPEQKRIAAILAKVDRLRRLRRYALDLSDSYLQSVFLEMFGPCLVRDRHPKFSDVLERPLQNGVFEKNDKYGSGTPVIWVDNLYHTISIAVEGLRRAQLETEAVDKYEVIEDDLLFTRSSLVREGIGQVNIVPPLSERTAFECHIIRARVDRGKVDPFYILGLYRSPFGRSQILKRSKTATMTTIGQDGIASLPCPTPPLSLQRHFAHIVHRFGRLRAQQREAERQAEHLFQTLLHQAFQGEL